MSDADETTTPATPTPAVPADPPPVSTPEASPAYDAQAKKLVGMFVKNFARFDGHVGADVRAASPAIQIAAE